MADEIGVLAARVVADVDGFRSDMQKAAAMVQSQSARINRQLSTLVATSDRIRSSVGAANRVLGAFGVSLSVRAFAGWIRGALDAKNMTEQQLAATQHARDAIDNMRLASDQLARSVAFSLTPAMKELGNILVGLNAAFFNADAAPFGKEIEDVRDAIRDIDKHAIDTGIGERLYSAEQKAKLAELNAALDELIKKQRQAFGLDPDPGLAQNVAMRQVMGSLTTLKDDGTLGQQLAALGHDPTSLLARPSVALENLPGAAPRGLNDFLTQQGLLTTGMQMIGGAAGLGGQSAEAANEAFRRNEEELTEFIRQQQHERLMAAEESARESQEAQAAAQEMIVDSQRQATSAAIGLLHMIGGEHRGAAIAAIALEKGMAIQRVLIESKTAAARVKANYEIAAAAHMAATAGFGTAYAASLVATGNASAAKVLAMGRATAAMVGVEGLYQAAQLSDRGMQSTLGTSANPVATRSMSSAGSAVGRQDHSQKIVEINIRGGVVDSRAVRELVAQIKEQIDDSDVIIFGPDSRQARLLAPGVGV